MKYADEEFLKAKKAEEKEREQEKAERLETELQGNVRDGKVVVYGKEIAFSEQTFLDGQLTLFAPTDLRALTQEEIDAAYLIGNKPQYVYYSESADMSLVLNHTDNPVDDGQVIKMAGIAGRFMEKTLMNGRVFSKKNRKSGDKTIASVETVSNGFDTGIYAFNFYISLQGRLLLGNWNCPAEGMERKKPLAEEMFETIAVQEKED